MSNLANRIHALQLDLQDAIRSRKHHDEQADKAKRREMAIRAELDLLRDAQ